MEELTKTQQAVNRISKLNYQLYELIQAEKPNLPEQQYRQLLDPIETMVFLTRELH